MSCAGWQIIFQRPNFTFIIACVPTICDVGVTSGIQPSASRTIGISLQHGVELVRHALLFELGAEVREHAAGHLVNEDVAVHPFVGRAGESRQFLVNAFEIVAQLGQLLGVELRAARVPLQQRQHALGVRLRGAVGEWHDRNLHAIHAGIDGRQVSWPRPARPCRACAG